MIILLLGTHLFLTIRLRFPQRYIFKAIRLSVSRDKDSHGDVSQFGALATALAATIGTGNIVGVGTAVALGGPGAVLWCWLTGVFGIATKYGEGLLAVKYRVQTANIVLFRKTPSPESEDGVRSLQSDYLSKQLYQLVNIGGGGRPARDEADRGMPVIGAFPDLTADLFAELGNGFVFHNDEYLICR